MFMGGHVWTQGYVIAMIIGLYHKLLQLLLFGGTNIVYIRCGIVEILAAIYVLIVLTSAIVLSFLVTVLHHLML